MLKKAYLFREENPGTEVGKPGKFQEEKIIKLRVDAVDVSRE